MFRWTTVVAPWLFIVCSQANLTQLVAGHPYQDRFSTAHSRPMPSGAGAVYSSAGQLDPSSEVSGGCNGGNCPRPTHAKLQLWVPDEATVYINGQRTKPQSLGGVHKNSRIYTLQGLGDGVARECEIVVESCYATGQLVRMQRVLMVRVGERLDIHYPAGFISIEIPESMPTAEVYEAFQEGQQGAIVQPSATAAPINKLPIAPGAEPVKPSSEQAGSAIGVSGGADADAIFSKQNAVPSPNSSASSPQ